MGTKEIPMIGLRQLDAVLAHLAVFERPGFVFGEWYTPAGQFPHYALSAEALDFIRTLDAQQMLVIFDWPSWQDEARRLMDDPLAMATADLLTLRCLLTTHVRLERFVEGHLASVYESGHVTAILRRLSAIRAAMGGQN